MNLTFTRLSAPSHFCYFTTGNIKLLLLGEAHITRNLCNGNSTDIVTWLETIFNYSTACINFYIETGYRLGDYEPNYVTTQSPMSRLRTKFIPCLNRNKSNCPYSNVEMFNTDIRTIYRNDRETKLIAPLVYYSQVISYGRETVETMTTVAKLITEHITELFDYIVGVATGEEAIYYELLNATSLMTTGNPIEDPNIIADIVQYTDSSWQLLRTELGKLPGRNRFLNIARTTICQVVLEETTRDVYAALATLGSIPMDIYTLAKLVQPKTTTVPCQQSSIFYGGLAHTIIYASFLVEWLGILPNINIYKNADEPEGQCITLPEPFDLFAH